MVGSVIPSSRFLERRIISIAKIAQAHTVVELGPGTGGTTRAILQALPRDSKLCAIEINPRFASLLQNNPDRRLTVHLGGAQNTEEILATHGLSKPDVILSGIPFSTMPPKLGREILKQIWSVLEPGGQFVAYQFRDRVSVLGREILGAPKVEIELINVPPMRVYCWRKPVGIDSAGLQV
jgi:phospholipid N-methyltransferase